MPPRSHKIYKSLRALFRVEAGNEFGTLGRDSPVAGSALAVAAKVTSERDERCGSHVARVRAERDRFYHVRRRADTSADDERNVVSYTLVAKTLIDRREREFDGNTYVIADTRGSRSRPAAKSVDRDYVRAAARDSACDRRDVMNSRHLDDNGLFVVGRFFKRVHELAQILDRIDVVVRCGRNGVRAFGNHTGAGDVANDF